MNHFERLGQPQQYALERDALEDAYLERAAAVHPDKFQGASSGEQRQAMEASAAVNEAYRTLRDPVKRAEYLVKLGGIDLDSSDAEGGAPKMPQAFLIEMIEQREQLDAAKQAGGDALEAMRDTVEAQLDEALGRGIAQVGQGEVRAAAESLVVRRYLQRLLDEIDDLD
ncbi:MAG: Fe-S protein assembly co-chaperone HscB [Myxococcota bacterium]